MIFAGAQKNIGPAGLTLVILRKDLAERAPETVPPAPPVAVAFTVPST